MDKIVSDSFFTTKITTQIGQKNSGLEDVSCATFDEETTVSGQAKAKESVTECTKVIGQFKNALQEDLDHIKQVADAFQQVDERLRVDPVFKRSK